ncbi:MAG TPA: GntR family transcriptional regulator [bacterium]|nr:GntR family transcriptional regulator [bacterium]HOL35405.1 GntR family transcriptional regulator [bacterium]HPP09166.1 GntR family transcriptional regulator [bacterium]
MSKRFMYEEIKDYLLKLIEQGQERDQLPTETQLSSQFGVSHITVRRALDELEEESLIVRIPGRGTFIGKKLRSQSLLHYMVILPPKRDLKDSFIASVVSGMLGNESSEQISMHILPYHCTFPELLEMTKNLNIDGVIWIAPFSNHLPVIRKLQNHFFPVIVVNRIENDINYVSSWHEKAGQDITEFLIKKGHRRIGFIGRIREMSFSMQRYQGFFNACKKAGMKSGKEATITIRIKEHDPLEFSGLKESFEEMLNQYKPTAVVVSRGGLLDIILDVVRNKKIKIPDELEIATFDEVSVEYEEKKYIHEVVQPLFDLGKCAGESLKKLITGEVEKVEVVLPCKLNLKNWKGGE